MCIIIHNGNFVCGTFHKLSSNSLIIHKESTKEIMFNGCLEIRWKPAILSNPKFLLLKSFCLKSNIKHGTQLCFITRWNTLKFVRNILLYILFSTLFSVFHLVMKHCISCLIYYAKWGQVKKSLRVPHHFTDSGDQ